MKANKMNRRVFIKNTSMAAAAVTLAGTQGMPVYSQGNEEQITPVERF